jgi:hypothetical protein
VCKRSGYYWVKNPCASKAIRVYCDFKTGRGAYYAYYGKVKDEDVNKYYIKYYLII